MVGDETKGMPACRTGLNNSPRLKVTVLPFCRPGGLGSAAGAQSFVAMSYYSKELHVLEVFICHKKKSLRGINLFSLLLDCFS